LLISAFLILHSRRPGIIDKPDKHRAQGDNADSAPTSATTTDGAPSSEAPSLRVIVLSERDASRLPGVTVILRRARESLRLSLSTTDTQGAVVFSLPGLGRYDIEAISEGEVINGSHSRAVDRVEALQPQLYEVKLTLDPDQASDIPLVSIRGSVRNNRGKLLPNARVVLYGKRPSAAAGPEVEQRFEQYREARVTTDSKGLYSLRARIWPGKCELVASHDDCSPLESDDTRTLSVNASGFEGEFHFVLADWPSVRVAGRVFDRADNPVPGARVDCFDLTADGKSSLGYTRESGPEGEFEFACRLDTCLLRVSKLGYQTQRRRLQPKVTNGAGAVRVTLERSTAALHGTVLTKDGKLAAAVEFTAYEVPPKDEPPANPPAIRFSTNQDGRFQLDCSGDCELIFAPVDQRINVIENIRIRVPSGTSTITLRITTIP
jgi:hypothetical protein